MVFNPWGRGKSPEKKHQLHGVPRCWVGDFLVLQALGGGVKQLGAGYHPNLFNYHHFLMKNLIESWGWAV